MSLRDRLARRIANSGPISVAAYMAACLHDPEFGYYATRPKLGGEGDFITAPQVSQMFGEAIGAWTAAVWRGLGRPPRLRLIELGPGDGTLIGDVLRVAHAVPGFIDAIELSLVEASPPLRACQAEALAASDAATRWSETLEAAADAPGPVVILANEFLDCLPTNQWLRLDDGWAERRVGLDPKGDLAFVARSLPPGARAPEKARCATPGAVLEIAPAAFDVGAQAGGLVAREGGAALFIDYGASAFDGADTLQAVRRHRREHPLANPGLADLTAHADFASLMEGARQEGAQVAGPISQRAFLTGLGIEARAAALVAARPESAERITRQLDRLIGEAAMGQLFRAVCLFGPGPAPPPFA